MDNKKLEKEIVVTSLWSPTAQLAEASELSAEELADAARKGAVWQVKKGSRSKPRRVRDIEKEVSAGDTIFINFDNAVLAKKADVPKLVSDQVNYSVWCKPSGMLSQGTRWSDHTTITSTAANVSGKKCLLVHRLDRAASGLIVLAHTKNAQKALCGLFESAKITKIYRVLVHGEITASLPWTIDTPIDEKKARTVVQKVEPATDKLQSALTVNIETGRKHQIRSHLAAAGYPVVGDRLFDPKREHKTDLQLAASELSFICPFTDKPLSFALEKSQLSF